MAATVLIQDIVDALQMQFDGSASFLDLRTGEVHTVSLDDVREAEADEEEPDPEDEDWLLLQRIAFLDGFVRLPGKSDVKGAFRHFKDTHFRDQALREIAIDWCDEHKIPWK